MCQQSTGIFVKPGLFFFFLPITSLSLPYWCNFTPWTTSWPHKYKRCTNLFKLLITKDTKGTALMKEHRVFLSQLLCSIFLVLFSVFFYKCILPSLCLSYCRLPPPHHHQCHPSLRPLLLSYPICLLSCSLLLNSSLSIFFPSLPPPLCQHSPLTRPDKMQTHTHTHSSPHQPSVIFTR